MTFALTGARVFDGDRFQAGAAVIVNGKHIVDVIDERHLEPRLPQVKLDGGVLAPGFIDVQVNGGGGALLNADPSVETVTQIAGSHRQFGTVGLLPTVITDAPEVTARAIKAVHAAKEQQPAILGIHIEGPFIDPARKGAHDARFIRPLLEGDLSLFAAARRMSMMVTVAPNKVPPQMIKGLVKTGALVSLGHADATFAEANAALDADAHAFTHLFNAMSPLQHREPGMAGAALADKRSFCSLIADGHHVHDAAMSIALAVKPRDRIMLISDAMPTAAGGPDSFELQGRTVKRIDGRLTLENGTLAGSNLTMDEAVRYCVNKLDVPLDDALRMASRNPAVFLGRNASLGRIARGYLASLVHLSDDLRALRTWVEGQ
jgi:N-acetylglucosamine-6-phosphate deacetylase